MRVVRRFGTDRGGATAVIFGLALVPLMAAVGGAVDYSRAAGFHSRAQLAVDAAALAIVREPAGASDGDIQRKGEQFVGAALGSMLDGPRGITLSGVRATRVGNTVTVSLGATVKTAVIAALGIPTMPVGVSAQATWGSPAGSGRGRIELALVLDNTGSMDDRIGGRRKMDELQDAAKGLLGRLRGLADTADKVKVSIVPFDTEVRLDPSLRDQPWFRWENEARDRPAWTGYVFDRHGTYAVSDDAPSAAILDSRFPAPRETGYKTDPDLRHYLRQNPRNAADLAPLRPLTSLFDDRDYQALDGVIGAMRPRGFTNVALGVTWGLATLSAGVPFAEGVAKGTDRTKKVMIVLTDGKNTMNHVDGRLRSDVSRIDASTAAACAMTRREEIEVFTIRLLEGDETLLRGCASNAGHYFDVQRAGELAAAFDVILNAISDTRLTH